MNKEKQKMPEEKLERLVNYQEKEIEQLQAKVNQLETNRDEAIELNKKINNLVAFGDSENKLPDLVWELSSILERGKE